MGADCEDVGAIGDSKETRPVPLEQGLHHDRLTSEFVDCSSKLYPIGAEPGRWTMKLSVSFDDRKCGLQHDRKT